MTPRSTWRKSSHSGSHGDDCVELAGIGEVVGIRDSKKPDGPKLYLAPSTFRALVTDLKR